MTVKRVRIGEILELRRDPISIEADKEYRRIGIYSWGKGMLHRPPVPGSAMGSLRYFTFPDDALLFSNIQAWEAAVAVSSPADRDHVASNRFLPYVPRNPDQVDVSYLLHYFLSEEGLAALRRASPGTQVRNRTLGQKLFEALEIPLPDLSEQRRIASHLNGVANHSSRLGIARWEHDAPPASLLPNLVASMLSSIAAKRIPLGSLCVNTTRVIHPGDDREGANEFVGLEHIESHTGRRIGLRPLGDEKGRKLLFQPGEVTYGYLRPYLNKAWVAERTGMCSVEQYVLIPKEGVDPTLLGFTLRSDIVRKEAVSATNNLQLPRLRLDRLMSIQVPDLRLISDTTAVLRRLNELTNHVVQLADAVRRRAALQDSLLPAARNEVFTSLR